MIGARNGSAGFFQVGFNRRFAPMAIEARSRLARQTGTRFVLIRVNAGPLPKESWLAAEEEGGGRILGEACHFIDLARFLIGAPIASVQAGAAHAAGAVCEDLSATSRLCRRLARHHRLYRAGRHGPFQGADRGLAGGGAVAVIEDFRRITITAEGRTNASSKAQDKGHAAALAAFVAAVRSGGPAPVAENELIESSLATIAVRESLRSGAAVQL